MLIITFRNVFNGAKITWFLNDRATSLLFFLFGASAGLIFTLVVRHLKKSHDLKKVNKIESGGDDLGECLDPDKVYEVIDQNLAKAIRDAIVGRPSGRLIVDHRVVILVALTRTFINIAPGFYTTASAEAFTKMAIRYLSAGFAATGFFAIPVLLLGMPVMAALGGSVVSAILVWTIVTQVQFGLDCANNFRELPTFEVRTPSGKIEGKYYIKDGSSNDSVYLRNADSENNRLPKNLRGANEVDISERDKSGFYFRDEIGQKHSVDSDKINLEISGEIDILVQKTKTEQRCQQMEQKAIGKQESEIVQSCGPSKTKYVPLSQRTRTLKDLDIEKALQPHTQTALEPYNRKAQQFAEKRERIKARRLSNLNQDNNNDYTNYYDL